MSVPSKIRTTGDLREFLLNAMAAVKAGNMSAHDASAINKLAQQTTENLYAELKAQRLAMDMSATPEPLGALNLGTRA